MSDQGVQGRTGISELGVRLVEKFVSEEELVSVPQRVGRGRHLQVARVRTRCDAGTHSARIL